MAHVGRRWPLHTRREMGLGTGHQNSWPRYLSLIIGGMDGPVLAGRDSFHFYCLLDDDWDGLTMRAISKQILWNNRLWRLDYFFEWIDGGAGFKARNRLTNSVDGLLFDAESIYSSQNNVYVGFQVTGKLAQCTVPTKLFPHQESIFTVPLLPNWNEWKTEFPGL